MNEIQAAPVIYDELFKSISLNIQQWFVILYIIPVFLVIVFLIMIIISLGKIEKTLKESKKEAKQNVELSSGNKQGEQTVL